MTCYAGGVTWDRATESVLQWAKRWQARYYASDYARLRESRAAEQKTDLRRWDIAERPRHIVVFKPDEIGDAVCALPALLALRRAFPETRVTLICSLAARPLFERAAIVDDIRAVSVKKRWLRFASADLSDLADWIAESQLPDIAIFLRTYPAFFRQFLGLAAKAHVHPRDPRLVSRSPYQASVSTWDAKRRHQALQLLEIVAPLTGEWASEALARFPSFTWREEDEKALALVFGDSRRRDYFVVHPYARIETRRYPEAYWRRLFEAMAKRLPLVVIGGPEDLPWPASPGVFSAVGKLSLGQTGYLLSRARAFVGNESGPAHWAAAMGVPTAVLFGGHSVPEEWGPLGDTLLLSTAVACSPCHRRFCPGLGVKCLNDLTPGKVEERLLGFLTRASSHRERAPTRGRTPDESLPFRT